MMPIESIVGEDDPIPVSLVSEPDDYGPCDSFDEPGPGPALAPDLDETGLDWSDESLFLDDPTDDEERDDEMILALLIEMGVDLDTLDDPEEGHPASLRHHQRLREGRDPRCRRRR